MDLVTPETMQQMDRRTIDQVGVPGEVLMDRAARGAVEALLEHFDPPDGADIGILCGTGNNGGDGLAMATMLTHRGYIPRVVVLGGREKLSHDAGVYFEVARDTVDHLHIASDEQAVRQCLDKQPECAVWCDALLGTGIDRDVGGRYRMAVEFLQRQPAEVLAVDIPSGVNGETGQVMGVAATAGLTTTFGFAKIGQCLDPGRRLCGELVVVDIGIPDVVREAIGAEAMALTEDWLRDAITPRPADMHKGDAGKTLHVGGRPDTAGAIALSARAALVGGAGLITVATDPASQPIIPTAIPEVMARGLVDFDAGTISEKQLDELLDLTDTVVVGPGLGTDGTAKQLLGEVLRARPANLVADADALNLVSEDDGIAGELAACTEDSRVVLTPHPGEAARLLNTEIPQILSDQTGAADALAERFGATVILKTATTVVAAPDGRMAVNRTGNPGMATGGMGDALTGLIAAAFTDAADAFAAGCLGTVVHGLAGDRAAEHTGTRGLTVRGLLDEVPAVWQSVGA